MRTMPVTTKITRRALLRTAAAAATAIPTIVRAQQNRKPPSERLRLAVIGIKKQGGFHVDTLLGFDEVDLVAVCDVDTKAREATRHKIEQHYAKRNRPGQFTGCDAYNEFERVLERPDIDAVVIATPDHWHALIAIAACRAGKDVFCEKPLSLTIREGRAMVEAARRYARVFQTGTMQRSSAEFRRACELVRNGYIGKLQTVHVECGEPARLLEFPAEPIPPGFDYERWLGPAAWAPYSAQRVGSNYWDGWRRFRDYSGGKMTDWGAHHFDIVQWGLAMDESGPAEITPPSPDERKVHAWLDAAATRKWEGACADPADPSWGLRYRYANGVEVIKDHTNGVLFVGSEGKIEVNRGHFRTWPDNLKSVRLTANDEHLYESNNHHQNFFHCIRTRRKPISDVETGLRSATVCHLGNIACWTGRPIRWDPTREEILNDPQAARMLDRPKRGTYS